MVFNEFKEKLLQFLTTSNVNLGRREAKTRNDFINEITCMLEKFGKFGRMKPIKLRNDPKDKPVVMKGSILRMDSDNSNNNLDIGKGVHSMTASESMRADEQLGRSPFGSNPPEGSK